MAGVGLCAEDYEFGQGVTGAALTTANWIQPDIIKHSLMFIPIYTILFPSRTSPYKCPLQVLVHILHRPNIPPPCSQPIVNQTKHHHDPKDKNTPIHPLRVRLRPRGKEHHHKRQTQPHQRDRIRRQPHRPRQSEPTPRQWLAPQLLGEDARDGNGVATDQAGEGQGRDVRQRSGGANDDEGQQTREAQRDEDGVERDVEARVDAAEEVREGEAAVAGESEELAGGSGDLVYGAGDEEDGDDGGEGARGGVGAGGLLEDVDVGLACRGGEGGVDVA